MRINLREKPDLRFNSIDHTGIGSREFWQQISQMIAKLKIKNLMN